jgi:hypothetical protein
VSAAGASDVKNQLMGQMVKQGVSTERRESNKEAEGKWGVLRQHTMKNIAEKETTRYDNIV